MMANLKKIQKSFVLCKSQIFFTEGIWVTFRFRIENKKNWVMGTFTVSLLIAPEPKCA